MSHLGVLGEVRRASVFTCSVLPLTGLLIWKAIITVTLSLPLL